MHVASHTLPVEPSAREGRRATDQGFCLGCKSWTIPGSSFADDKIGVVHTYWSDRVWIIWGGRLDQAELKESLKVQMAFREQEIDVAGATYNLLSGAQCSSPTAICLKLISERAYHEAIV